MCLAGVGTPRFLASVLVSELSLWSHPKEEANNPYSLSRKRDMAGPRIVHIHMPVPTVPPGRPDASK
jgi:hypothetical protein